MTDPHADLKHGARVYPLDGGETVLVKQTIQRQPAGEYVIDEHRERHCDRGDPYAVGRAVLDALAGQFSD